MEDSDQESSTCLDSVSNVEPSNQDFDKDRDLKLKSSELEELKSKYKLENEEKAKLQDKLDKALSSQSDNSKRLQSSVETNERLKLEVKKKTEEVDKLQRNVNILEDRVRNLEIKASEVEKAELTLESTRKLLESSQIECRGKETEIRRMTIKLEETEKNLEQETAKNEALEKKMSDLKQQVRQELMKNELIEKGLETIPRLEEKVAKQQEELEETEKELHTKTALLTASKQSIRDYIDKIREADEKVSETEALKENLSTAQHEIRTLKHLMKSKDAVMFQKLQAIEQVKHVLTSKVNNGDTSADLQKLKISVDRLCKTIKAENSSSQVTTESSKVTSPRAKSASYQPFYVTNGHVNNIDVNRKPYSLNPKNKCQRPVTAVVYPNVRPNTAACAGSRNKTYLSSEFQTLPEKNIFTRQFSYKEKSSARNRRDSSIASSCTSVNSEDDSIRYWRKGIVSKAPEHKPTVHYGRDDAERLSCKERDEILSGFINLGDRVKISIEPKPPRYGRKKLKNINYSGIVKYKGNLDRSANEANVMIGVKLDDAMGDTDGCVNGKNFMFTPVDQGKFFKIRDVTSVFDKKSGSYISTEILIVQNANQYLCHSTHDDEESRHYDSDHS